MTDKFSLRRRCFNCRKRVNLRRIKRIGRIYIKCPRCLSECLYTKQKKYEREKPKFNEISF